MATHQKKHIKTNKRQSSYSLLFKDVKKFQDYASVLGTPGGKYIQVKIMSNNTEGLARPPNNIMKNILKGIRDKTPMIVLVEKNPAPPSQKVSFYSIVQLYSNEQVKTLRNAGEFAQISNIKFDDSKEDSSFVFETDSKKINLDEVVIDDDFIAGI